MMVRALFLLYLAARLTTVSLDHYFVEAYKQMLSFEKLKTAILITSAQMCVCVLVCVYIRTQAHD